ncbi:MFS transporter [Clostridium hydrogenum]|uniref:MFS transporter n=1 Tax=Clostridium hydrogenum TaxID=2855764 RepID=UPI001F43D260|nr:MFS transporter [Clostridium hydrogenum]
MNENVQSEQNEERNLNYSWITFILFFAGTVIMSSLYITIPLVSVFSKAFSVSQSQAVWTSSLFSICFAIGCLFYGPLSDRYGRKKIILIGLAELTIISLILGLQNSLQGIIVFRGLQGIAAATFSPVALSFAVELFPSNRRVGAIGCISTGFLLAGIVGQIFSSNVSSQIGWKYVFYILSLVYLITFLLILIFIPKLKANGTSVKSAFVQMPKVFKKKSLCFAYIIALIPLFSFVGMYTALNSFLSSPKFAFSAHQIFYVRLIGIVGMVFSPVAGKLVKKFGMLFVLRTGLLLSILGLVFLGISTNINFIIIMSVVFVIGIAITVPTLISLIGQLGGEVRGAAVSVYTFILFLGASAGPAFTINILKNGSYEIAFLSLAVVMLIGIISSMFITLKDK